MLTVTKTEVVEYWPFGAFLLGTLVLCAFMLTIGFLLGTRTTGHSRNLPFESGINSVGTARLRLSVKFYLVGMFFVIFDVEALYLYAWASIVREAGWIGFIEASVFVFVLLVGLVYLIRTGTLDWTPEASKRLRRTNL